MKILSILFLFVIYLYGADSFKVATLFWSMNIEGQVAMREGLLKQTEIINNDAKINNEPTIELIEYVAGDDAEGIEHQITQMYDAIDKRVDLIVVQPTDNAALIAPLLKANELNIPVVAYDQYISDGKLHSYLTSDNYTAGYLNGEYISSLYEDEYKIKLILVEYPHVSSTVERVDGFLKYTLIGNYKAVEPVSGKKAGEDILKDFPNKWSIDVVFTVNDGGGLSVVDQLVKANRDEIVVATIDGDPRSVENIKKGSITKIDTAQFCGPLGGESIKVGYDILRNKRYPAKVLIPVFPITKDTLSIYPGWLGPIPDAFKKQWYSKKTYWDNKIKYIEQ